MRKTLTTPLSIFENPREKWQLTPEDYQALKDIKSLSSTPMSWSIGIAIKEWLAKVYYSKDGKYYHLRQE